MQQGRETIVDDACKPHTIESCRDTVERSGPSRALLSCVGVLFQRERHGNGPIHLACEGAAVFEIYPLGSSQVPSTSVRIGLSVDDVDACVDDRIAELGGSIVKAPHDSPWGRRAVVKDPDGHTVELVTAEEERM